MARRSPAITLRVVLLECQGYTQAEIGLMTGRSNQNISAILASQDAARIRKEIENRTIDTAAQIRSDVQAVIPTLLHEQIDLALHGKSEAVRANVMRYLMELGGHSPIKQVAIHRPDPIAEDYADKSEEEIRRQLLESLNETEPDKEEPNLLH